MESSNLLGEDFISPTLRPAETTLNALRELYDTEPVFLGAVYLLISACLTFSVLATMSVWRSANRKQ